MNARSLSVVIATALAIAACAPHASPVVSPASPSPTPSHSAQSAPKSSSNSACVGAVSVPPSGASPVEDPDLLKQALGAPNKGALCEGKVYEVKQPMTVYRVWDSAVAYTEMGRWWSFDKPSGPKDRYREQNAICPEWSPLNTVSECQLKVGTHFVIGPGQSAECKETKYAQSSVNQIFVPNDSRNNKLYVENCKNIGAFLTLPKRD